MKKFLGALASDEKVFEIAKKNYENYFFKIDPVNYDLFFSQDKLLLLS